VGAYDSDGDLAGFSTRSSDVDVAAPGADIVSTLPGDRHGPSDCTSMAAPMATGAAAALLAHRPICDLVESSPALSA
jgi:subtilisin family serine protease